VRGGKGGKNRMVYFPEMAIAYLENWLKIRGRKPRRCCVSFARAAR